jgi:hypothetical protein
MFFQENHERASVGQDGIRAPVVYRRSGIIASQAASLPYMHQLG